MDRRVLPLLLVTILLVAVVTLAEIPYLSLIHI